MSKHTKIRGLVCIGLPENLKWINDMKHLPDYLVLCGDMCRFDAKDYMRKTYGLTSLIFFFFRRKYFNTSTSVLRITREGSWTMEKPLYVCCNVYFTESGRCFVGNIIHSEQFIYHEDLRINFTFINHNDLCEEVNILKFEDVFMEYKKKCTSICGCIIT